VPLLDHGNESIAYEFLGRVLRRFEASIEIFINQGM
jgi:hypothetical protein